MLVADDDVVFRGHLARALQARGFDVSTAESYEEAMERTAERSPKRAIVDLKLGTDNGLELVRDLKRVDPSIEILVLTGYGSIATAVRAVRLGAMDYLTKPADVDEILQAFAHAQPLIEPKDSPAESQTLARAEWEHIQRVLLECEGNVTHAAHRLGLHRRSLQRKLARRPRD